MALFFYVSNLSFHSLLFLSFSITLIRSSFGSQHPPCQDDDRSALLQFKHSFVFDQFSWDPSTNYAKLASWKVGDDCCSWDGVDCDDVTGHVIGLDLSSSFLYGSINSTSPLFRLVHLTSLNLSFNNFNLSRIPRGIRNLSELTHLNLSVSYFSGQIPSEILRLSKLVSLDLSLNPLVLEKPGLKDVVEAFTLLSKLHLSDVTISSHVPHTMSNLTSLSSLLLRNCSLLGEFPSGIFRLHMLRFLSLRDNPDLTGYLPEFDQVGSRSLELIRLDGTNFSGQLPISIGKLKSLSVFNARGCSFGGLIPWSIGNLTKLSVLDLSENYLLGSIPSSFSNLFQLTYLALSYNNFSSSTLHWLRKLTNLQTLQLIETNSYGPIPSSLQNLTNLDALWLGSNQLSGQIPSWLGNSTQFTKLTLSYNELQGPVPDSIFQLPNIQAIDLAYNNLSGSLEFNTFLQPKYLSYLHLSMNHLNLVKSTYANATLPKFRFLGLSRCNLSELPTFLRGQHKLEILLLFRNSIEGHVPNWIFGLEMLVVLNLAHNFLTGFEHPPGVTLPWTKLNILDLANNEFEGLLPIPPPSISIYNMEQNRFSGDVSLWFCNLTSLLVLQLSENNLSGNLPSCLGNLGSSALVMNLRNNSLLGKIPDNFDMSCALKVLDLSQNRIGGKVPRSVANCSMLEILILEGNQMNDVFPFWLGNLSLLRVLSLRSNKFHGAIGKPASDFGFEKLQIIDLSDNNFVGKLPVEYFQIWVAMRSDDYDRLAYMQARSMTFYIGEYMWSFRYSYSIRIMNKGTERAYDRILEFFFVVDLSRNKFEGEISQVIGTLGALQSLNLSNNILTGHIPSSLKNIKRLEALDLSANELSGNIPTELTLLTFLSVINVSCNNLTGTIPRGNQFETFLNESFLSNPGLCGYPLSKTCENTQGTLPLPPSENNAEDSLFEFNWEIVLIGCGTGLLIGVAFGCALDTRKYERLVKKKFGRRHRRGRRN